MMNVSEIDQEDLLTLIGKPDKRFVMVDVREEKELDRGVLPDAIHIPMSQFQGRVQELDKASPVIVYCEHGVRSFHVAAFLLQHGYDAQSLRGGFAHWQGPREPHAPK